MSSFSTNHVKCAPRHVPDSRPIPEFLRKIVLQSACHKPAIGLKRYALFFMESPQSPHSTDIHNRKCIAVDFSQKIPLREYRYLIRGCCTTRKKQPNCRKHKIFLSFDKFPTRFLMPINTNVEFERSVQQPHHLATIIRVLGCTSRNRQT